jgi:hypothetical protein
MSADLLDEEFCSWISDANIETIEKKKVVPSNWRTKRNAGNFNIEPGFDDLKHINRYIKKGAPDFEIMEAFGLSARTMQAIRENRYSSVDGISQDNIKKIQQEFLYINKQVTMLTKALTKLVDTIFIDKDSMNEFMKDTKFQRYSIHTKKRPDPFDNNVCD